MWHQLLHILVTSVLCYGFYFLIVILAVIAWWKEVPGPKHPSSGKIGE